MSTEPNGTSWSFAITQRFAVALTAALVMGIWAVHPISENTSWAYERIFTHADLNPCSRSCLLGISLDMPYEQVIPLLSQHSLVPNLVRSHPYSRTTVLKVSTGLDITITGDSQGALYLLQLELPSTKAGSDTIPSPELGQLIDRLGPPQWVAVEHIGCIGSIILSYGELRLMTQLVPVLQPTTPVRVILLHPPTTSNHLDKVPWQGFAPVWRYEGGN